MATVVRMSVSTKPEYSIEPPPGPWTEAFANAVAISTVTRLPKC